MEGEKPHSEEAMAFSWSTDWAEKICASPVACGGDAAAASPQDSIDSMILLSGARVVMSGLRECDCRGDDSVIFINAGGGTIEGQDPSTRSLGDSCFEGGDVIETDEPIVESGDYPSLYRSARYGNFSYKFEGLAPGDYFLDLHFAEIVNTNGPKGIRAFDVLVQEEKILSDLDVYAVVGGNRPLQLLDVRVTVESSGVILINFKGVRGIPMVCGIRIRKAPSLSVHSVKNGHALCNKCSACIEVSPIQKGKLIAKYEKKIQELTSHFSMKSAECFEAWSSFTAANQELDRLKMELYHKVIQSETLEQVVERQTDQLRDVSQSYQRDKKLWAAAISNLERKIKAMKQEQSLLSLEAYECANSIPDLSKMIGAVQGLVAQCEELKLKYNEEMSKRKKLHNIVQEAKGNIRVFCRCRPLSKDEMSSGYKTVVDFDGAKDGDIGILSGGTTKKTFKFDRVYTPQDDQADVYADASPLVTSVLDGYNVSIFAYGQTGTGKTFTMEGIERNRGVNYRTLEELFKIAEERKETVTYSISVSVLEVYNEQIRDLLATSPSSKKLEIRQAGEGSHHVPGIVEAKVENIKGVWDVLQAGSNARAVGSNNVNEHSSRSHCMLCIMVRAKNILSSECTSSKLWLVDLAGSERLAKTDVQGERLKEAQNINRSLSALGDVISALAAKSSHIPYRNSKLTHLLQDSLGGDSKALMFVQISPSDNDVSETLSSLNFASRVRGIELGPAKKQVDTAELQKVKQMLEKAKQEARLKDDSLRKLEENCQNLENKAKGKEQICKNLQEKVKELESRLESKMQSQITSEKQQGQLSGKLKEKEEMCTSLQQKLNDLECRLREQQQSDSEITVLQQKIEELELRIQEQEHLLSLADVKVRELGLELLEKKRFESMLQLKVRDLENNLQVLQDTEMMLDSAATAAEGSAFSREETLSENEHHILRSSDSANKQPVLANKSDAVNEKKRKGDATNASIREQENNFAATQNAARKRSLPSEPNVRRRTEQVNNVRRLTTTTTTTTTTSRTGTTQKIAPNGRVMKQQQAGGSKTRGWLR